MATVTAVMVLHDGAAWLPETLDAVALQSRPPQRLVIVDTGSSDDGARIVARHARVRACVGEVSILEAPRETSFGAAVEIAMASVADPEPGEWLWLLHDDSAPSPLTLRRLLETARRSPSVAIAGPKLVQWDDARRLREVGQRYTRSGRRAGGPAVGEPDQGQHDHRTDVFAVGTAGMLVRREVFVALGGFDRSFAGAGEDLDLAWRAHLAGHRVIVVPQALVREAAASSRGLRPGGPDEPGAARRQRRRSRQVALARCAWWAMPLLAAWIALSALGSALALLLVKRPRKARVELGDLAALGSAWRTVGARRRFRGRRTVHGRDLRTMFVPLGEATRLAIDAVHDAVAFEGRRTTSGVADPAALETGPVSDEAETYAVLQSTWTQRVVRHPGFLAVFVAAVMSVMAWRTLLRQGGPTASGTGLSGGSLLPVATDASGLWHAWLDGWHGMGLGSSVMAPPHLPVLAAGAWVVGLVPGVADSVSPVGVAIAWLLYAAIPLSAWSAYLAGRVFCTARWPRAWAALAWASLATLTTALASGRLGAVVAHILLPLVLAGLVRAARPSATTPATFGAVLAAAVAGAFAPDLLVLFALLALLLVLFGRGWARLRGLVLLVLPLVLLGPWVLRLLDEPRLLLAGPGLTSWQAAPAAPWQLALLHPGGPGSYPALLSAPLVLVGLLALTRRGRVGRTMTLLGALALSGLLVGLAAAHVTLARVPQGRPDAGRWVTPWPGTGLDLLALALIAAALLGVNGWATRARWAAVRRHRAVLVPALVVSVGVGGVLASLALAGWQGVDGRLQPGVRVMPAAAASQATSPLANRLLVLSTGQGGVGYRLQGSEPGDLTRDLPAAKATADPVLSQTVSTVLAESTPTTAADARNALLGAGVGFVGVRGPATAGLARHLDATAGLSRLGDKAGLVLWRVLPRAGAVPGTTVSAARVRIESKGTPVRTVDVSGAHSRVEADLEASSAPRSLVVAEPRGWADHARVTFDGRRLAVAADAVAYPLPSSAGHLSVTVEPAHGRWHWIQLGLLALVVFLAVPFGNARSRRTR